MTREEIFESLATKWGAPIVARAEIERFTGGAVSAKYLANQDCLGTGPEGRFKIGIRVVYPTVTLVEWLKRHAHPVSTRR